MNTPSFTRPLFSATLFLIATVSIGLVPHIAHATVGGPTFIHDFTYNPANESVYYRKISGDGRGCPPELMRLSLASGATDKAFSCDEGEALLETSTSQNASPVEAKIYDLTKTFKLLTPISLKKNNISVDVRFVNYQNISPEIEEIQQANFVATVLQNGIRLAEFPIVGCTMDQPFGFAGYAIPGFEKKIVLLRSSKGDCWEGGYIRESLHVVGGISGLDKTSSGTFYKYASALVPSEGTLVVYAKDVATEAPTEMFGGTKNTSSARHIGILLAGAIILSLGIGIALGSVRK